MFQAILVSWDAFSCLIRKTEIFGWFISRLCGEIDGSASGEINFEMVNSISVIESDFEDFLSACLQRIQYEEDCDKEIAEIEDLLITDSFIQSFANSILKVSYWPETNTIVHGKLHSRYVCIGISVFSTNQDVSVTLEWVSCLLQVKLDGNTQPYLISKKFLRKIIPREKEFSEEFMKSTRICYILFLSAAL